MDKKPMIGIYEPKPARGFPAGRVRWIMRNDQYLKAAVRTAEGVRIFIVADAGDAWEPLEGCEQASKTTAHLADGRVGELKCAVGGGGKADPYDGGETRESDCRKIECGTSRAPSAMMGSGIGEGSNPSRLHTSIHHGYAAAVWIPVSDELPDDEMTVLVVDREGDVMFGFHDAGKWYYESHAFPAHDAITHWMEMPESPEAVI